MGIKDENVVKLTLLYFLKHVLLGKEGKKLTDMQCVSFVDSLEGLSKYPKVEFL